jgi:hypothetical protein
MSMNVKGGIDWDNIEKQLSYTNSEQFEFGFIVVQAIVDGIIEQVTYKGQPLDINSKRRLAQKMRLGKPLKSLIFTGHLSDESSYEVNLRDKKLTITLESGYAPVHLDLILISGATGKNYKDFFGVSAAAWKEIMALARKLVLEKLQGLKIG